MDTVCNCAEYPHRILTAAERFAFQLSDGRVLDVDQLQPGQERAVEVEGHHYVIEKQSEGGAQ